MTNIITKKAIVSVFLTDLAAYVNGILRGEWVALPTTREELDEAFERVTCGQDHETFVTDYESEFGVKVDEYENIYKLNEGFFAFLSRLIIGLSLLRLAIVPVVGFGFTPSA